MAAVFAFGKRGANNRAPVSNYLISKGFDFDGVKVGPSPFGYVSFWHRASVVSCRLSASCGCGTERHSLADAPLRNATLAHDPPVPSCAAPALFRVEPLAGKRSRNRSARDAPQKASRTSSCCAKRRRYSHLPERKHPLQSRSRRGPRTIQDCARVLLSAYMRPCVDPIRSRLCSARNIFATEQKDTLDHVP